MVNLAVSRAMKFDPDQLMGKLKISLGCHGRVVKSIKIKFLWLCHPGVGSNPSHDACVLASLQTGVIWHVPFVAGILLIFA